jgi:phage terminase large subunit-like protein
MTHDCRLIGTTSGAVSGLHQPIRQPRDQVVQSWDTAVKVTAISSYSVCMTFLVRNNNEYHLLDLWRKRVEFPDLVEAVRSQAAKHNPTAILIEEQASAEQRRCSASARLCSGRNIH